MQRHLQLKLNLKFLDTVIYWKYSKDWHSSLSTLRLITRKGCNDNIKVKHESNPDGETKNLQKS